MLPVSGGTDLIFDALLGLSPEVHGSQSREDEVEKARMSRLLKIKCMSRIYRSEYRI